MDSEGQPQCDVDKRHVDDVVKAGSSKMGGMLAVDMLMDDRGRTVSRLQSRVTSCQTCLNSAQEQVPHRWFTGLPGGEGGGVGTCKIGNGEIRCGENLARFLEYHGKFWYKIPDCGIRTSMH